MIVAPYNYVLNQKNRISVGLNLKDSILLFDEAHNLENAAESS